MTARETARRSGAAGHDEAIARMEDLRRRGRGGLWCGGVLLGGSPAPGNLLDHGLVGLAPAALALIALAAAFAWMVRRWGAHPPALRADAPAAARAARPRRRPAQRSRRGPRTQPAAQH